MKTIVAKSELSRGVAMNARHGIRWLTIALLFVVVATGIGFVLAQTVTPPESSLSATLAIPGAQAIATTEGGLRYIVDPSLLVPSGTNKDGIPSIDSPTFVSVEDANQWLNDDDLVLALTYQGVTRVYPLRVLIWHEIVNDIVAGDPILISYCPLCGSAMAYVRSIDGEAVEFGTSGNLYNSNLVMYDRQTGTYWSQMDGLAIVGELSGQQLMPIGVNAVLWGDWKSAHPDSDVLSQQTGFDRNYTLNPYGSYSEDAHILFPVQARDDRLHPKTVVLGIEINGVFTAYREQDILARGIIQDRINGIRIRISLDDSGAISVINLSTQEVIVNDRSYWFAWYAFHPETRVYLPSG